MIPEPPSQPGPAEAPPGTLDVPDPRGAGGASGGVAGALPGAGAPGWAAADTAGARPGGSPDVDGAGGAEEDAEPLVLRGPRRRWVITFAIGSAVVLTMLALAVLYSRWYGVEERSSVIDVLGYEAWDSAEVTVEGGGLGGEVLKARLTRRNGLHIRFHVPPGVYTVTVKRGRQVLAQAENGRTPLGKSVIWWPFRVPDKNPPEEAPGP